MNSSKIILISVAFIFGLSLILISALRLSFQSGELGKAIVLAQEGMIMEEEVVGEEEEEATGSAQKEEEVDYYLAYPGILPDHPLYWLKMIRDRILLALTQDPTQRFNRLLLYADKRLGAAKVLIEGSQPALGVTTATKAEKYLEQALASYKELEKNQKVSPELRDHFKKALLKHSELITELADEVPEQTREVLRKSLQTSEQGLEKIINLE